MDKPDLTLYLGGTRSGKSAHVREAGVFNGPAVWSHVLAMSLQLKHDRTILR